MPVTVTPESPRHPEATALLHASHAYSASLYKPEENFVLSVDDLCAPDIRFFAAREGDMARSSRCSWRPRHADRAWPVR